MTNKQNFDGSLDNFYNFLLAMLENYNSLVPVLQQELNCIIRNDVSLLGENLKSQQVLLIQTRDFDKLVSEHSCSLNIYANNLTEMTLQLPEEQQPRFFKLLDDFDKTFEEVNFHKEKCRVLLQSKLHVINKTLAGHEDQKDSTTYDKNASEIQGSAFPKSFEKKV